MKSVSAKTVALMGILGATAVAFSFVEGLLPPLPFLPPGGKAGFSNVVVMAALQLLNGPAALCIALIKSAFALITRGGTAAAMSLAGGMLSTLVMWLCVKQNASFMLTGILGAVTHNAAQLCLAVLLTQTPALFGYGPILLLFSLCAGCITGFLLRVTYPPLCRLAKEIHTFTPKK